MDNVTQQQLEEWQADPISFMVEALDVRPEHIWGKMREVAESVRDNQLTAVAAGHSVSKTYEAPRISLWFLCCFPPATVLTTAPSHDQVANQFWRELRTAHANARLPIGGKLTMTQLDLQAETDQVWFALGISTRPDTVTAEATKLQGYHNKHLLLVFDEAAGILPQIWKAGQHLLTGQAEHMKWLAQGNPTSPTGDFAEAIEPDSGWNVINISATDTPNYKTGKQIVPGIATREYVEGVRRKYGENSNEFKVRILGQKPDFSEGTIFGRELAKAFNNGQLGYYPHIEQAKVYTVWDIGPTHTAIWFVQFVKEQIRIIDFIYDSKGLGLPQHLAMLQQRSYVYAQHFVPWDIGGSDSQPKPSGPNAKNYQTGKYTLDVAKGLGFSLTVINKAGKDDQFAAGRGIIPRCLFHKPLVKEGWDGLRQYRFRLDPAKSTTDKPVYFTDPVKDWAEHVGSAFCGLGLVYLYQVIINQQRIGYPYPLRTVDDSAFQAQEYDALRFGLKAS